MSGDHSQRSRRGRLFRRTIRFGALSVAAILILCVAVGSVYWLTAPQLVVLEAPSSEEAARDIAAADGVEVLLFNGAEPAADNTYRPDLALETDDGELHSVAVQQTAVLAVPSLAGRELRLTADAQAQRPLGDGLLVEVFVEQERYSWAVIGTEALIVDAEQRRVPVFGPNEPRLPPNGMQLTHLLPPDRKATLRVARLSLGSDAPDGPIFLAALPRREPQP